MTFRDREKRRLTRLKSQLFSASACQPGFYRNRRYDFCLHESFAFENIHESIRSEALKYFDDRAISWHDGAKDESNHGIPSNHLCCSQSSCVNLLFPFIHSPRNLRRVLQEIGYSVSEMLPITLDHPHDEDIPPYVGFEWIGERNYLNELSRGQVANDGSRSRGSNFTSTDFILRFAQVDGKVRIVLGEWKYTEYYPNGRDLQRSSSGRDRTEIYKPFLDSPHCQIALNEIGSAALFYDPFDQLMRQQLLASEMEMAGEMEADIVSLLHIAPAVNHELMNRITSPDLRSEGDTIHEVWEELIIEDRFRGLYLEDLMPMLVESSSNLEWSDYLALRYGGTE